MATQVVDVCKKECGKIWYRKPTPQYENGLIVTISHTEPTTNATSRLVRFLHAAFDLRGERFVAGDHQGNLYNFDVIGNRFSLVKKASSSCTALAFSLRRHTEFLVGLADYSLKCFDTVNTPELTGTQEEGLHPPYDQYIESKELVAWIKGHESSVQSISVHASGRYALTSSTETAQLWDLDTFTRKRKLNIKENVGIVKVFFLPLSNTILTCLKDDSIFVFEWDSDSLVCKNQLPVPEGRRPHYKAFACTKDGRLLAAGGKSRFLHIWSLETRQILRIIQMPKKVTCVKQVEFLNESFDRGHGQILGVLCQDGIMRFINTQSCKLLFDIGQLHNKIYNAAVSPTGRHIVAVTEKGSMDLYDVTTLYADINKPPRSSPFKPPPPLVQVLEANQMHDQTNSTNTTTSSGKKLTSGRVSRRKENIPPSQFGEVTDDSLAGGMDRNRLVAILKGFGEYPTKYRLFIWRSMLQLPENHAAYAALVDKGTHPAFSLLHEHYPIKSRKLLRVLQRCLSALGHWSPIFGETDYLPMLAFPFVKMVQNNQLVCFEIVASVLVNWCQHWFEYFPNPPVNILSMVENVLAHHDKELLQHFVKQGVTSQIYAWPLLETLFSEVLTKDEWLRLMDHVFSNHPSFLLLLVAAYCLSSRGPLMHCTEVDDFKYFFHHRNACDLGHVIKEAYRLQAGTPSTVHPRNMLEDMVPLTRGQYPVFNKYPKFIVDYQVQERDRLRQEELEYVKQRQLNLQIEQEVTQHRQVEEAWYRQQKLLLDAEEKRRQLIQDEEQKIVEQRTRLQAMNREVRLKELQLLDAARRKYMGFQQQQKQVDLKRLDDELDRKTRMRERETVTAIEEAEIRNMDLQVQRRVLEQELDRAAAESQVKFRGEEQARARCGDMEDQIRLGAKEADTYQNQRMRKEIQQSLARAQCGDLDLDKNNQADLRHQLSELNKERDLLKISRLHKDNLDLERRLHGLVKQLDAATIADTENRASERDTRRVEMEAGTRRRLDLVSGHEPYKTNTQDGDKPFERLRDLREESRLVGGQEATDDDDTASTLSSQISLDRNRDDLDREESELLREVYRIRERLAKDNRAKTKTWASQAR